MKKRTGFVSNSSSTSFTIENTTDSNLHLRDFVRENPQIVEEFYEMYEFGKPTNIDDVINQMVKDADAIELKIVREDKKGNKKKQRIIPSLKPGKNFVIFGDQDGNTIGLIYDYALRSGGKSKRFKWEFLEYNR
jgi:hypothetical protein